MKKIDENSKITLTVAQLKNLVKESRFRDDHPGKHDSMTIDYDRQKVFIIYGNSEREVIVADTPMGLYAECTGWDNYRTEEIKEFCQTVFLMKIGESTPSPYGLLKRVG